jgi:uncharacterized protein YdeI (YjbR/CyaY-like superfamily)
MAYFHHALSIAQRYLPMQHTIPEIDRFIAEAKAYKEEMTALRHILLDCGLTEAWKWRQPCYCLGKKNVVMIMAFKSYLALGFFKGALMKDPEDILVKAGENSQSGRQIRFESLEQILQMESTLKSYIKNAIEVEKKGLKQEVDSERKLDLAAELLERMEQDPALKKAFKALSPGRQRGYNLFFTGAKQSKSRAARVEKHIPRILAGKGIHDCVCGLSKRMPTCDGSHKTLK